MQKFNQKLSFFGSFSPDIFTKDKNISKFNDSKLLQNTILKCLKFTLIPFKVEPPEKQTKLCSYVSNTSYGALFSHVYD